LVDVGIAKYESNSVLGTVIDMLNAIPELRQATRDHDRAVVDSFVSSFAHCCLDADADADELRALARSLLAMMHAVLSEAIVYKTCDRRRAIRNLRVAAYALIGQVVAPVGDAARNRRRAASPLNHTKAPSSEAPAQVDAI
jgi:hypothetical protein